MQKNNKSFWVEKVRRCLISGLVGDAVGALFENKSIENISSKISQEKVYVYTDDTQMTLSICEHYLLNQKLDSRNLFDKWTEASENLFWIVNGYSPKKYQFGLFRGTGNMFRTAIRNKTPSKSAGNGASKRIAPVAIAAWRNTTNIDEAIQSLRNDLFQITNLTHTHFFAFTTAYAYAVLLLYFIGSPLDEKKTDSQININEALDFVYQRVKNFEDVLIQLDQKPYLEENYYFLAVSSFFKAIKVNNFFEKNKKESLFDENINTFIKNYAELYTTQIVDKSSDGFSLCSILLSIMLALKYHDKKYEDALKKVLSFGGDTKSVASMTLTLITSINPNCYPDEKSYLLRKSIGYSNANDMFTLFGKFVSNEQINPVFKPWITIEEELSKELMKFEGSFGFTIIFDKKFEFRSFISNELKQFFQQNSGLSLDQLYLQFYSQYQYFDFFKNWKPDQRLTFFMNIYLDIQGTNSKSNQNYQHKNQKNIPKNPVQSSQKNITTQFFLQKQSKNQPNSSNSNSQKSNSKRHHHHHHQNNQQNNQNFQQQNFQQQNNQQQNFQQQNNNQNFQQQNFQQQNYQQQNYQQQNYQQQNYQQQNYQQQNYQNY
ncbi:adp-ribosylglycohydrolase family protein [Anaeramoeba ignava]|uniref:ADP-ribosylhydrolase ARH3 n=1 Tax=Anaeramoeba ignava TaxID=1746090 RepID=A0A9Q0L8I1_ANAIG|nr:adp-ribosylglycohydrolase family protein [Anaeramoeba ignava]